MTLIINKSIILSRKGRRARDSVEFTITPEMSESRSVNYVEVSDIRLPASVLIWMGSPSRNFSLNAKFLARSVAEADLAWKNTNLLKSWCVTDTGLDPKGTQVSTFDATNNPHFKKTPIDPNPKPGIPPATNTTFDVGAGSIFEGTPPVLLLEGYGGQFRHIPVVITSLNIALPSDVDYIRNTTGQWIPIINDVSISLKEARDVLSGPSAIDRFLLKQFKEGTLDYW